MSIASRMAAQEAAGGTAVKQTTKSSEHYQGSTTSAGSYKKLSGKSPSSTPYVTPKVKDSSPIVLRPIIPPKPTEVPRYYQNRGIDADPSHDWWFDPEQRIWVWTMTEREKSQAASTQEEYDNQFIRTNDAVLQSIRMNGVVEDVNVDSEGKEYVYDRDTEMLHYLKDDWREHPEMRADADKAVVSSVKKEDADDGFWSGLPSLGDIKSGIGGLIPKLPTLPSMPKFDKADPWEVDVPSIPKVGWADQKEVKVEKPSSFLSGIVPDVSGSTTALLTVGAIFVGVVVMLMAVGYSGVSGGSSVRRR